MNSPTAQLAAFAAGLRFDAIPESVVRRAEDLLVDWFGSAVAGHGSRPVESITRFAQAMGPQPTPGCDTPPAGPAEVIVSRARTSPYLAAMANAAASHVAEQDDVHNGSVFHPATVVFPAAVATAQALGASGQQLLTACVAGYEVGIRVGEFLGRSHYKVFHTTGTAGTLAAAAAVRASCSGSMRGRCSMLSARPARSRRACGSSCAPPQIPNNCIPRTRPPPGLMSAYLAKDGFTGAAEILEGPQGMAAGMSSDADPAKLTDGLGSRWATAETSFKYHASCRHTHPAADALLQVMQVHGLKPEDLARVVTHVHQGAIDVLGPVLRPATVHQSKFSMGTVLALVARFGHAGLAEFDRHFQDDSTQSLRDRVSMELDAEVDAAYPQRWIGKVTVHTTDGRVLHGRVDEPKGDPGNTLSREEISAKALQLAAFSGGATAPEMQQAIDALWQIARVPVVGALLPDRARVE